MAEDVADGDLEIVSFADETVTMLVCMHEDQSNKEMGLTTDEPGAGCALFEPGRKGLSPELERLVAKSQAR